MKKATWASALATLSIASLLTTSIHASTLQRDFSLSNEEGKRIEKLKLRYRTQTIRPQHCPLQSTSYSEIAAKLNSIKQMLFECSEDKSLLDEISVQTTEIQDSIDKVREASGHEQSSEDDNALAIAKINGQSVADITKIINSALMAKECRDTLNSQTFLGMTAETILNVSQLGLLIPNSNGLVISAGGAVIGSVVKLIDTLLNRGYDFENAEDRNSFIKLNCAFYDLRRELEEGDAFKVYAEENQRDLDLAKELLGKIEKNMIELQQTYDAKVKRIDRLLHADIAIRDDEINQLKQEAEQIEKQVNQEEARLLKGISGLDELKVMVDQQIEIFAAPAVTVTEDDPAVSQMINKLYQLELVAPILIQKLKEYTPLSSSVGQDRILIRFLEKLDYEKNEDEYLALQTMEVDNFNNVFRARLLAGLKRVSKDIGKKQDEVNAIVASKKEKLVQKRKEIKALEERMISGAAAKITINGQPASVVLAEMKAEKEQTVSSLKEQKNDLEVISEKLKNYIRTESTREDEGTSSRIDMSDDFNAIANNIYGTNGYEFLMQSKESSEVNLETFNRMFDDFAHNYLTEYEGKWYIPINLSKEDIRRGCQDGRPFIRKFTAARDWKELGYDFLATNADLFHGYKIKNFIFSSKQEKIQNEHKAVIFTQMSKRGEQVPEDMEKYVGKGFGGLMQEVDVASNKAAIIQRFIHENDCNAIIEMR